MSSCSDWAEQARLLQHESFTDPRLPLAASLPQRCGLTSGSDSDHHHSLLADSPASFRKLRGPTYIAVIADELAFWYVDAAYANPDVEILNAVEPGLATTGGPLILASSPHARRGARCGMYSNATTAQVAIRSSSWLTARPGPSILDCRSAWSIVRWRRTAPARPRSISRSSARTSRASSQAWRQYSAHAGQVSRAGVACIINTTDGKFASVTETHKTTAAEKPE